MSIGRRIARIFGSFPTAAEALEIEGDCIAVGDHIYVVKNNAGAVESLNRESKVLERSSKPFLATSIITKRMHYLFTDTKPFPKQVYFGEGGIVICREILPDGTLADFV